MSLTELAGSKLFNQKHGLTPQMEELCNLLVHTIICGECGYVFDFDNEPCAHLKNFFKEIIKDERFKEW
jgi:Fe2+ or Zn2+ uptake regulation protein